jgi:hypothetical protein
VKGARERDRQLVRKRSARRAAGGRRLQAARALEQRIALVRPSAPVVAVAAALVLAVLLAWPLLFTDATFNKDWLNHLWYVWHQSHAIRENGVPSLFLEMSFGVFYPFYAFYGGTLYALTGGLSIALGNLTLDTYILTYIAGFAAAYLGWYWLSRSLGLGRWLAHVPGVVFVTSASYLTLVYSLGDWPEFLALSTMPLLIASALAVARADRARLGPMVVLSGASIVFFGSHLLTVVWGSAVGVVCGAVLLALLPSARRSLSRTGTIRAVSLIVLGALVSAWFLLPLAAYESQTVIARDYPEFRALLEHRMYIVAGRNLFTLSRATASNTILVVALPVLAMAWTVAGIGLAVYDLRRGIWLKATIVMAVATVVLIIVMTHAAIILALPRVFSTLQFSYRLESYVLLAASGAVLSVLALNRGGTRRASVWRWALVPILVVSIVAAIEQAGGYEHGPDRSTALASYLEPTFEQQGLFNYVDGRLSLTEAHLLRVVFSVRHDHAVRTVDARPGQLVDTNLRASEDLMHIVGARIVEDDPEGNDVLEIERPRGSTSAGAPLRGSGPSATIEVSDATGAPIVIGRYLSLAALAALLLELGYVAACRLLKR